MDFIIGGSHQGKREYVERNYPFATADRKRVFWGKTSELEKLDTALVIYEFHLLIKRMLRLGLDAGQIGEYVSKMNPRVIVADEIGYGLVPVDAFERLYRETAGRQCCQIATRASKVIRMVCGVPTVIKQEGIPIYLVRHGMTKGNEEKRYVGTTDESLSKKGRTELQELAKKYSRIKPDIVLTSPMKRCIETAKILFPGQEYHVVEDFRECDFGKFEYKNYKELSKEEDYQRFIDSNGMAGFPEGELPGHFRERCQMAFVKEMKKWSSRTDIGSIALVVHGGTIMSLLDQYSQPHKDYFSWQVPNGQGYEGKLFLEEMCICSLENIG
ncbi:bifunctional adenosylcobinamide kinase/adenosylcobinamide-phosphate guanylyltransferase [[Clostridium] polysaccharolyticum]|uniref:Adenosylcobinamide kinase /adenosylcobinamide-phosphate guanylyltransferase n=1 Tax=[Clostridium] polysaccharolyticum TaxID=29364 RepID=A0A1I0DKS7_9FIRM|nr:bifunctional adenosylcobinamide kinase/adenosylcobinamide-phosphate guanylyltransferase [[Clostridium] polysaccharolyticum]SET32959.1 adenosylcobinamide kinase /adenosylcobinamide-phosphate guanylyltransferase [[Clostridium] polysaccharolyticum]